MNFLGWRKQVGVWVRVWPQKQRPSQEKTTDEGEWRKPFLLGMSSFFISLSSGWYFTGSFGFWCLLQICALFLSKLTFSISVCDLDLCMVVGLLFCSVCSCYDSFLFEAWLGRVECIFGKSVDYEGSMMCWIMSVISLLTTRKRGEVKIG